jgi:hypothetical protein
MVTTLNLVLIDIIGASIGNAYVFDPYQYGGATIEVGCSSVGFDND